MSIEAQRPQDEACKIIKQITKRDPTTATKLNEIARNILKSAVGTDDEKSAFLEQLCVVHSFAKDPEHQEQIFKIIDHYCGEDDPHRLLSARQTSSSSCTEYIHKGIYTNV